MKQEYTIDFHLRWAWQKMANLYNKEAHKFNGTMSMGFILLNIEKEGTPSTSLGPKMGMKPTSLARSLNALEEAGLIKRKIDTGDKRRVLVHLTPKGKKFRDKSKESVLSLNEIIQSKIDDKKLKTFFEVISQMNDILDNTHSLTETNEKTRK